MSHQTCSVCQEAIPLPALISPTTTTPPTYYCGTKCRTHAQTRETIYRSGGLIRDVFYAFREAAFDMKIKRVRKRGGVLHVYEGEYLQEGSSDWDGPLFRFPGRLVKEEDDKARLLSMQACTDAMAYTYELSRDLFQGVATTIEEAFFSGIRGNTTTARYYSDGIRDTRTYAHEALVVETANGESYIFDIAGAQNGQFEPVVPFDTFVIRETAIITQLHPHGRELGFQARIADGTEPMRQFADIRPAQIQLKVHEQMRLAIQEWEKDNKISVKKLVSDTPQDAYEESKKSLLAKISADLKAFVAQWEKDGKPLKQVSSRNILPDSIASAGQNRCTVKRDGAGSRAFQKWWDVNMQKPEPEKKPDAKPKIKSEIPSAIQPEIKAGSRRKVKAKPKQKAKAEPEIDPDTNWNGYMDQFVESFKASGNVSVFDTRQKRS